MGVTFGVSAAASSAPSLSFSRSLPIRLAAASVASFARPGGNRQPVSSLPSRRWPTSAWNPALGVDHHARRIAIRADQAEVAARRITSVPF
jgi:hypothetical protein